jgi:hypothetical protein
LLDTLSLCAARRKIVAAERQTTARARAALAAARRLRSLTVAAETRYKFSPRPAEDRFKDFKSSEALVALNRPEERAVRQIRGLLGMKRHRRVVPLAVGRRRLLWIVVY